MLVRHVGTSAALLGHDSARLRERYRVVRRRRLSARGEQLSESLRADHGIAPLGWLPRARTHHRVRAEEQRQHLGRRLHQEGEWRGLLARRLEHALAAADRGPDVDGVLGQRGPGGFDREAVPVSANLLRLAQRGERCAPPRARAVFRGSSARLRERYRAVEAAESCPTAAATCPATCSPIVASQLVGGCLANVPIIGCYPKDHVISADLGCIKKASGEVYALSGGGSTYAQYLSQDSTWVACSGDEAQAVSAAKPCP